MKDSPCRLWLKLTSPSTEEHLSDEEKAKDIDKKEESPTFGRKRSSLASDKTDSTNSKMLAINDKPTLQSIDQSRMRGSRSLRSRDTLFRELGKLK